MTAGVEILVICRDAGSVRSLVQGLSAHAHRIDVVGDLATAGNEFLARGGHDLLLIAPDLAPGRALAAVQRLREIDPDLPVLVFGEEPLRGQEIGHLHRIASFHPGSRAGLGAVQKLCCSLKP